jgi:NADPH:quinone reductase-like Zn-dependent oxidoreductase
MKPFRMKAIVYDKSNFPNLLVLREVEKPVPGENEVLVKIHAVSINAADYRSMRMGIIPKRKIFGADIAGRVEATGKAVKKFKIGDDVFGDISGCGFGGFAEYAAVPESFLALQPASVSYPNAAAAPMAAVTALQGLRDRGGLQPGQKVLIYGAGGGVGTFAVQLAKHLGAHVTAVCGENNIETVRSLGADRAIDYAKEDVLQSGEHFDLILGINGSHSLLKYRRALAPQGVFVMVGGGLSQIIFSLLFGPLLSMGGKKMRTLAARPSADDLAWVIQLVAEGKVKPVIDRCYPFNETAAAMQYASLGHASGKVILTVA